MLLAISIAGLVLTLAVWAIAKATLAVLARLDVDAMATLVWLGLAEWPVEPAPRRARPRPLAASPGRPS